MTISRLRQIAQLHSGLSEIATRSEKKESRAGRTMTAAGHADSAIFHANIAHDLNQLADAFEAVGPLLTLQK